VLGVVLTMVQQDLPESAEASAALRRLLPSEMVLKTEIPRDDLFVKASARGVPAGALAEGETARKRFEALCKEVDQRIIQPGQRNS